MKNFFTKAIVCAGVLASAMAISSVAVFADVSIELKDATTSTVSDYYEWSMGDFPNGKSSTNLGLTPSITYDSNYSTTQGVKFAYVAPHTTKVASSSDYNAVKTSSGSAKYVTVSGALPSTSTYSKYDLIITLAAHADTTKDTKINILDANNNVLKDITIQPPVRGNNAAKHLVVSGLTENTVKFAFANGQQSIIYAITLDYTKAVIDSDVYELNFSANSELDIDKSEFTITPSADGTSISIDYDETNGKYTKSDSFPSTLSTTSTGIMLESTEALNDKYKKYTYLVTPQASWFDEKATYTISGNVYNSATGSAVSGLTITATNGTGKVTTGTGFEVTGIIGSTDVTFSATGYQSKEISANEAKNDIVVDLIPNTVDDGTTEFSVNKILAREGYTASSSENVDSDFNITVNNFALSGNAKLQLFDSNHNPVEKDGYIGRINLNANAATITYTPDSDGFITIYATTGSNSDLERGVGFYQGDTKVGEFLTNVANTMIIKSYNVEANKEYTIKRAGNNKAVNIYAVKFTQLLPSLESKNDYYANISDNTYIIHALTENDLSKDSLTLSKNNGNAVDETITTDKVYKTIKFSDNSTITAGEGQFEDYAALFAVKLPNLIDDTQTYTLEWELS